MNNTLKYAALAAFVGTTGMAHADPAETKGGIKIKTEDGRFEANVGGLIQFDGSLVEADKGSVFGSGIRTDNASAVDFRRIRLILKGKAYGWEYEFVPDFSQNNGGIATTDINGSTVKANGISFQELFIATKIGPGKLQIGQFKAYRSMEDQTSSGELTLMERSSTGAGTGIYAGKEFINGLGYFVASDSYWVGGNAYSPRNDNDNTTSGFGYGGRAVYFPIAAEGKTLHLGLSASREQEENARAFSTSYRYGGRRGANTGGIIATPVGGEVSYLAGELAGSYGPFTGQAEFVQGDYSQLVGGQTADAYSVTLSYYLTGETKPYKKEKAVFSSPKPLHDYGALELAVRYDEIKNTDAFAATAIKKADTTTVGLNWIVNPNVRFALNYGLGSAERVNGTKDQPNVLAVRAQMGW